MTNQSLAQGARSSLSLLFFRVYLPFAFGYFLSYLYRTVNAVISVDITRDLSLNAADLGLLTSAYYISFAAFQLPLGLLLDRYGPRRVHATLADGRRFWRAAVLVRQFAADAVSGARPDRHGRRRRPDGSLQGDLDLVSARALGPDQRLPSGLWRAWRHDRRRRRSNSRCTTPTGAASSWC